MSAIYGAINLRGGLIPKELGEKFTDYYSKFKIDRQSEASIKNAWMGAGIQEFFKEIKNEQLPILDEERNLLYTADAIVDNRDELVKELGLAEDTPDGRILYEAYVKWGRKLGEHAYGAYAMVVYDYKNNKIFMTNDHFATRCLFYHIRDGVLYFSTLFFGLIKETGLEFRENERWLVDEISIRGPIMMTEPRETAVLDVYKIVSGTYVEVDGMDLKPIITEYYRPAKMYKTDWSITLEESERMVRETLANCVAKQIRDSDELAITLSAGLDSTAVGCTASKLIEGSERNLYAYTSVPDPDAGLENKGYLMYDESENVKKLCAEFDNMVPHFIDSKGRNYLKEVDHIIDVWELPCKSQQNAIWLDEIYTKMNEDGRKIVLSGSTGNCTISAGNVESTFMHYLKKLNFKKALEYLGPLEVQHVSKKRYLKALGKGIIKYYTDFFIPRKKLAYGYDVTNISMGERYLYAKRFCKEYCHYKPYSSVERMNFERYMLGANAQIGEIEAKFGLTYGLLLRDPMRTDEFIRLCYLLPIECFSAHDYDRRLVREGMKGVVPEFIRHDVKHRGRQSGDNKYRASLVWEEMLPTIKENLFDNDTLKYLDEAKLKEYFDAINFEDEKMDDLKLLMLVDAYTFSRYLKRLKSM